MAFARTVTTTHTKTLISPSTGSADLVYGADYVSATSHTSTPAVSGAISGGIPYFDSATSEASSGVLTAGRVVLGGGAGAAPNDSVNLTFSGATLTVGVAGTTMGNLNLGQTGSVNNFVHLDGDGLYGTTNNVGKLWRITSDNAAEGFGRFTLGASSLFSWNSANSINSGAVDLSFSRISAGVIAVGTGASGNSAGSVRAKFQSSDGSAGVAAFGPAAVASITIKDGIVVAIA